jgi:hypothetical protein
MEILKKGPDGGKRASAAVVNQKFTFPFVRLGHTRVTMFQLLHARNKWLHPSRRRAPMTNNGVASVGGEVRARCQEHDNE